MSPPHDASTVQEQGETHPSPTVFWAGHYPKLKPRDVLVEQTNKRWRVVDVNFTEKRREIGHQIVRAVEILRGDIEQKIPIAEIEIPTDTFLGFYPPDGSGLL